MQIHHSLFLTALASACARAQNLTSTSVVATASATPSKPGDPTQLSSYPLCAQKCNNQSIAAESFQYLDYGCDITQTACVCQPLFRATTAACEEVVCDMPDYKKTQALAQQLCGPFYQENITLGSAVSSAIVSATSAALAATKSKVPSNPAEYPPCGQVCLAKYIPISGCGSLANRTCICGNKALNSNLVPCEKKCNSTDLEKIFALANKYCVADGRPAIDPSAPTPSSTESTPSSVTSLPSPSPFTSHTPTRMAGAFAFCIMVAVGLLGVVVSVL